jgi:outer membrane autotransporter protein
MIASHSVARAPASLRNPIRSKPGLKLGAALGAIALAALAQPAFAQNECGSPNGGTVTCTSANNPYPNGVTYVVPPVDLTINVNPDVVIDTRGGLNIGVFALATGSEALTLNAAPASTIRTDASGAFGVLLATNYGSINSTTGIIRTTGTNAGGVLASSYTGNITVVGGNTSTTGANANGLEANNNRGNIVVNSGVVATTGAGSNGVVVRSDVGNVAINVGSITTQGANSVGASATTGFTGTATINGGTISTAGTNAFGAVASSSTGAAVVSPVSVTTTGIGADAIRVTSTGNTARATVTTISTTGANARGIVATGVQGATVNYGTVTTTGAGATGILVPAGVLFFGPQASSSATVTGTGRLSTAGAGADGIFANATNGVTINVGQVSTTGANSRGIVARGGGAVTVNAAGVTTTGATSTAVSANSTAGSVAVALTGANGSTSQDGVNISAATTASLSLAAGGTLNGGANGATIASGTGTTVTNAGTLGGTTYALSVTGGAANVTNSGTINGRILLTGNADTVTNSGTFNATAISDLGAGNDTFNNSGTYNASANLDFGAGTDVFNNSGTVRVLPGTATAGTITLLNLETLNNSGLIDFRNGHTGDVLSLPGTYAGSGAAQLGLDVNLIGTGSTADRLSFGGAASGSTTVSVTTLNTTPAVLNSGVVLVQAGAASPANAFVLNGGQVDQGLIQYGIVYNPTNLTYNLVGTPGVGVFRTSLFAESARNLWLQSGDAWSGHMRELRDNIAANGAGGAGGRFWAQALGQVEERDNSRSFTNSGVTSAVNLGYKQDYFGGQIGLDFGGPAGDGGFAFGVTGGYLNSNLNFANSADRVKFDAVNGGVYASYTSGVVFVNLLGKYDYYWGDNKSVSGRYSDDIRGSVYGGKAEVGFRLGNKAFIEPSASVSYTRSDFDDFGTASGNFVLDDDDGIRGKAGARAGFTMDMGGSVASLYAGGNYVHEFRGDDRVTFTSGGQTVAFNNRPNGDYGEGTLGLNIGSDQGAVSGFMEGRYARSFNGSEYEGFGGRAGMRIRF